MEGKVKLIKGKSLINSSSVTNSRKIRVAAYCRVSTDGEEQINSFESQKQYYTQKISSNKDWKLVNIYADEAITGTRTEKRVEFKQMIQDALNGKIDLIITKSISRFARNTVDTLNYVRQLKEVKVAVFFEEENINTLSMDGELLLTILSSVAQQEVYNTSGHVKKGLRMKLERSEMIGSNRCLGYDYNKDTKSISINSEEAKIVKHIFTLASEGYGSYSIARQLKALGYKTLKNNSSWNPASITQIIRNVKYYGDAIYGNKITIDPITKKRVLNKGEGDKYLFENHHEAIVSKELWDKANELYNARSSIGKEKYDFYQRDIADEIKGKYIFSKMIYCGCCGKLYTRRFHGQGKNEYKPVWKCAGQTKIGKAACSESKTIDEAIIKIGFVKALNLLTSFDNTIIDSFIDSLNQTLNDNDYEEKLKSLKNELSQIKFKQNKLLDLYIDQGISKETYDLKNSEYEDKVNSINKRIDEINSKMSEQVILKEKLNEVVLKIKSENIELDFDDEIFKELVRKVIIGNYDTDNYNPFTITYVFKTRELSDENYQVILSDKIDYEHVMFASDKCGNRRKVIYKNVDIKIAIE